MTRGPMPARALSSVAERSRSAARRPSSPMTPVPTTTSPGFRDGSRPPAMPKLITARQPGCGRASRSWRRRCGLPPAPTASTPSPAARRRSRARPVTARTGAAGSIIARWWTSPASSARSRERRGVGAAGSSSEEATFAIPGFAGGRTLAIRSGVVPNGGAGPKVGAGRVTCRTGRAGCWCASGCGTAPSPRAGRTWGSHGTAGRTPAGSPWRCSAPRSRIRPRPACGSGS